MFRGFETATGQYDGTDFVVISFVTRKKGYYIR